MFCYQLGYNQKAQIKLTYPSDILNYTIQKQKSDM